MTPTGLDLDVNAERFAFQEWAGVLGGLKNIAVEGRFHTTLKGPLAKLDTTIDLEAAAAASTDRSCSTRPSRLAWRRWARRQAAEHGALAQSGRSADRHLPAMSTSISTCALAGSRPATYSFAGSHAGFMDYEADDVKARGELTDTEVRIAEVTATAYGANVTVHSGTIGIPAPYPLTSWVLPAASTCGRCRPRCRCRMSKACFVRLRRDRPVLRVVHHRTARFDPSEFLGASLGAGTSGSIDTSVRPFHYQGEGDLTLIDLHRFGVDLGVEWLQEPRYAGTVSGRFHVDGSGCGFGDRCVLTGGGRIDHAELFDGRLTDAEVSIELTSGSLTGSYDGTLREINPSIALPIRGSTHR